MYRYTFVPFFKFVDNPAIMFDNLAERKSNILDLSGDMETNEIKYYEYLNAIPPCADIVRSNPHWVDRRDTMDEVLAVEEFLKKAIDTFKLIKQALLCNEELLSWYEKKEGSAGLISELIKLWIDKGVIVKTWNGVLHLNNPDQDGFELSVRTEAEFDPNEVVIYLSIQGWHLLIHQCKRIALYKSSRENIGDHNLLLRKFYTSDLSEEVKGVLSLEMKRGNVKEMLEQYFSKRLEEIVDGPVGAARYWNYELLCYGITRARYMRPFNTTDSIMSQLFMAKMAKEDSIVDKEFERATGLSVNYTKNNFFNHYLEGKREFIKRIKDVHHRWVELSKLVKEEATKVYNAEEPYQGADFQEVFEQVKNKINDFVAYADNLPKEKFYV